MSEHFQGQFEVELKYRLLDKAVFIDRLKAMPHEVMLEDNQEFDCYFDYPSETQLSLKQQNKSICIREMQPSNIKLWIVKGPEADRCEAVNISDTDKAKSMLTTMGLIPALEMRKTRSIYFIGEFHVTVDHLTDLGDFAELAIMTDDEQRLAEYKKALTTLAIQLDLQPNQKQTQSYRQLYEANQASI